ncbi:MAG: hypothetical protein E7298_13735 [Lachnospiraceae bacterium]|nr:hypothetical protein [Lachnospiraceae bacterium]
MIKDNKELALIYLQEDYVGMEDWSARIRNDEEVASKLLELHGVDSWAWYHMSKRIKKKFGIEED